MGIEVDACTSNGASTTKKLRAIRKNVATLMPNFLGTSSREFYLPITLLQLPYQTRSHQRQYGNLTFCNPLRRETILMCTFFVRES